MSLKLIAMEVMEKEEDEEDMVVLVVAQNEGDKGKTVGFFCKLVAQILLVDMRQNLNSLKFEFWVALVCPPRVSVWLISG